MDWTGNFFAVSQFSYQYGREAYLSRNLQVVQSSSHPKSPEDVLDKPFTHDTVSLDEGFGRSDVTYTAVSILVLPFISVYRGKLYRGKNKPLVHTAPNFGTTKTQESGRGRIQENEGGYRCPQCIEGSSNSFFLLLLKSGWRTSKIKHSKIKNTVIRRPIIHSRRRRRNNRINMVI